MQQYDLVVRSSMQQYVVVLGSCTQFFLIPVVSLPTSNTSTYRRYKEYDTYVRGLVRTLTVERKERIQCRSPYTEITPRESGSVCLINSMHTYLTRLTAVACCKSVGGRRRSTNTTTTRRGLRKRITGCYTYYICSLG